jgi:hypothetical protein
MQISPICCYRTYLYSSSRLAEEPVDHEKEHLAYTEVGWKETVI